MTLDYRDPEAIAGGALPVFSLVRATYLSLVRNGALVFRAAFFPCVLLWLMSLWQTPDHWGVIARQSVAAFELLISWLLWAFMAISLQRLILSGPQKGKPRFLPRLDQAEMRFAGLGFFACLPLIGYGVYYGTSPIAQLTNLIPLAVSSAPDRAEAMYGALFCGWMVQIFAFVTAQLVDGRSGTPIELFGESWAKLRSDFSRLYGAAVLVSAPIWIASAMLRLGLANSPLRAAALEDDTAALVWNLTVQGVETLEVVLCAIVLVMVWTLAYARSRGRGLET